MPASQATAAYLSHDDERQSAIGVFTTSRYFAGGSNTVVALDARLRFRRNWLLSGQAVASATKVIDGSRLAGPALGPNSYFRLNWDHRGQFSAPTGGSRPLNPKSRPGSMFSRRIC